MRRNASLPAPAKSTMSAEIEPEMAPSKHTQMEAPEDAIDEFVRAMEEDGDSEEGLKKAFQVLSKDKNNAPVSTDVLRDAMQSGGMVIAHEEFDEIIRLIKANMKNEGQISCEEFIKIMKLLKEPTVGDQLTTIYGVLTRQDTQKIVLYGEPGVGKTWMARKVASRAKRQGKFDIALWIYSNRIYEGLSLQESIAYQLSIFPTSGASEAKDVRKKVQDKAKQENLEGMIHAALKGKRLLLISDDEESATKRNSLCRELPLDKLKSYKLLITRRYRLALKEIGIMVKPLTQDEAKSLVLQKWAGADHELDEIRGLVDLFIGKSERLPSEVLVIAKTMSYFGQTESGLQKLLRIKEILEKQEQAAHSRKQGNLVELLISAYDRLPRSVLVDCYSFQTSERHFFHQHGVVHYNELISYWIMEGHLGHFDCIEDAYEEGHRVLMDLVDFGLLKKIEAGYVVSSGKKFNLDIQNCYKFFRSIHLGLATMFECKLGRIALADGMLKTISSSQGGMKLSALMLNGNHFGEIPDSFFESESELEILAIFNPTHKPFPLPIFRMKKLSLLLLRGCEFLETMEDIFQWESTDNLNEKSQPNVPYPQRSYSLPTHLVPPIIFLRKLTVLEVSGPSSLKTIPDSLFKSMPYLRSLNLSFLQIELLPTSLYHLTKLEFLILRGCSSLKKVGTLKNFRDLQVLDLSGATSVENFQDKSFTENKKLQILNLSQAKIEKLPMILFLEKLKSLSLCDCADLLRLRKVRFLRFLQILDISGATKVEEFLDPSFEDLVRLEVLDVSRTAIRRLPSNIGSTRYLYMRGCSQLKELLPIEAEKVEVLDFSGCCNLQDIKSEFFSNMKFLRELNLSKTSVKHLPSLSCLGNLRRLLLSQCLFLEKLEELSSLEELEVLDLSGCKALLEMEDNSFHKMNCLHSLDLSGLQLDHLPSLSNLMKLKTLYVRDCPKLTSLPGLEELPALEILDHSRTTLKPPPSFNPNCHPLVLGPSSLSLDNFDPLQLLKDLGATNSEVLSDNTESTRQLLEQPNMDTQVDGAATSDLPQKELDQCNWSISSWHGDTVGIPANGIHFLQLLKMHPSLLTKNFSQFHFFVYPTEEQAKLPDKSSYTTELSLRDIYLGQFSPRKLERCVEIRGFSYSPPCLGHLLKQAELVVLIDDPFLKFLLDLGADSIKAMRACWIGNCSEMEHVIGSEKVENSDNMGRNFADNLKNLEILWISDVIKLRSISNEDIQRISFQSLTCLYLEYCPQLSVICFSSLQLQNLETLYIRYCQNLGTLFKDESPKLESLTSLHLWGLPKLKEIPCQTPSLVTLRVGECPMLEHVISSTQGSGQLEILQIKFCDKLKSIFESQQDVSLQGLQELELWELPELKKIACRAPSLQILRVGGCPLLENVVGRVETCGNLKVLEVKCCGKVKTIVQGGGLVLWGVEKMELLCLPELKSTGALLPYLKEENCMIWGCPKLEKPSLVAAQMEASQVLGSNGGTNS